MVSQQSGSFKQYSPEEKKAYYAKKRPNSSGSRSKGFSRFHLAKLSSAENNTINGIIKRSWKNGRESGVKFAYRKLLGRNGRSQE